MVGIAGRDNPRRRHPEARAQRASKDGQRGIVLRDGRFDSTGEFLRNSLQSYTLSLRYYRLNSVDRVDGVSGFLAVSSFSARFETLRLRAVGFTIAGLVAAAVGCSSAFMARRWPSNTVVSQLRSFSISTAQIFAAAAASLSGPATSRSCMPSPVLLSFTTMIGRNAASGAFDLDLSNPRHNARRPLTEFAPPTSTPNSVRWTATLGDAGWDTSASGSSAAGADATTSGLGTAAMAFAGALGSISFAAAA